jgi:aryl-alcohol dehydrogenase-like predicted oxidoreductase
MRLCSFPRRERRVDVAYGSSAGVLAFVDPGVLGRVARGLFDHVRDGFRVRDQRQMRSVDLRYRGVRTGGHEFLRRRRDRVVFDPIAAKYDATRQQIALAWQLHRTPNALPIPGTTSAQHLRENLAAAHIRLTEEEVDAITALALEEG